MMTETQKILMKRDGLSAQEAKDLMDETREALLDGDWDAIGDILGLEDDYIFDLL